MVISNNRSASHRRERTRSITRWSGGFVAESAPRRTRRSRLTMEFVMTGRSMLLASALMAAGGVWSGSASAAPIHADMSLQGGAVFEQVQGRGHGGGSRGGGGMGFSRGGGGGPGMSFNR